MLDPDVEKLLAVVPRARRPPSRARSWTGGSPRSSSARRARRRSLPDLRARERLLPDRPADARLLYVPVPGRSGARAAVPRAPGARAHERARQHLPRRHRGLRGRRRSRGGRRRGGPAPRLRRPAHRRRPERLVLHREPLPAAHRGARPAARRLGARRAAPAGEVAARAGRRSAGRRWPTTPGCGPASPPCGRGRRRTTWRRPSCRPRSPPAASTSAWSRSSPPGRARASRTRRGGGVASSRATW